MNIQVDPIEVEISIISLRSIVDFLIDGLKEHAKHPTMTTALRSHDFTTLKRISNTLDCLSSAANSCHQLLDLYIDQKGGQA